MDDAKARSLIRQARDGSLDALGTLLDDFGPRLNAFVRFKVGRGMGGRIEVDDVVQETFIKAMDRIEDFEGSGKTTMMGWLAQIASHEAVDQARYHRRGKRDAQRAVPLEDEHHEIRDHIRSQTSLIYVQQRTQQLEEALAQLKPEHRDVLLMRKVEELTFAEIAERTSKSPDAARMLVGRAMAALTKVLADQDLLGSSA